MNLVSLKPPGHFRVLKAYKVAEMINRKGDLLQDMRLIYTPMVYDGSSFRLGKAVCEGISDGVKAVVR